VQGIVVVVATLVVMVSLVVDVLVAILDPRIKF
jgi:peptide/nickel transport system permease protein